MHELNMGCVFSYLSIHLLRDIECTFSSRILLVWKERVDDQMRREQSFRSLSAVMVVLSTPASSRYSSPDPRSRKASR